MARKPVVLADRENIENLRLLRTKATIISSSEFAKLDVSEDLLLIVARASSLSKVLETSDSVFRNQEQLRKHSVMFVLEHLTEGIRAPLDALFQRLYTSSREVSLPLEEIVDIVRSRDASNYVIGGSIDFSTKTVTLVRGDMTSLVVPFSTFSVSGKGVKPDFAKFSIEDDGQTLKFGDYEASLDAVLYEYDHVYRRKHRAELAKRDKSFGASLKRLRLQKGLRQSDIRGVTEREVRRIESGEVVPHQRTLERLASALGVGVDEIRQF
jgi:hypothetical protein